MRKTMRVSNMKKRIIAVGMALAMTVGITLPAYAAEYTYNAADFADDSAIDNYAMPAEDWYGSYSVVTPTAKYHLTISPYWDDPTIWKVSASRISWSNGEELVDRGWSGDFFSESKYGMTNFDEGTGYISGIVNWNGDKENPDVGLGIAYNPTTNEIFLGAAIGQTAKMTQPNEYGSVMSEAFAPIDDNVGYKKISEVYPLQIRGDARPDWYQSWVMGDASLCTNWEDMNNGQAPRFADPFDPFVLKAGGAG